MPDKVSVFSIGRAVNFYLCFNLASLRGAGDGADAKSNLVDTKNGFDASRSDYGNGNHVDIINMTEAEIKAFREAAYEAGATKVLDPLNEPKYHYNHFHIEW